MKYSVSFNMAHVDILCIIIITHINIQLNGKRTYTNSTLSSGDQENYWNNVICISGYVKFILAEVWGFHPLGELLKTYYLILYMYSISFHVFPNIHTCLFVLSGFTIWKQYSALYQANRAHSSRDIHIYIMYIQFNISSKLIPLGIEQSWISMYEASRRSDVSCNPCKETKVAVKENITRKPWCDGAFSNACLVSCHTKL